MLGWLILLWGSKDNISTVGRLAKRKNKNNMMCI